MVEPCSHPKTVQVTAIVIRCRFGCQLLGVLGRAWARITAWKLIVDESRPWGTFRLYYRRQRREPSRANTLP